MPTALQASMSRVPAGAVTCLPSTVMVTFLTSAIISLRQNLQLACLSRRFKRTRSSFQVRLEFAPPLVYDRHRRNRGRIAQWTERPTQHVLGQVLNVVDVLLQSAAIMEASESFLEPVSTFTAGNAPAATFVLVELHDSQGKFDHASLVVNHHNTAGAQELSALAEGIEVHVHLVGFFRCEDERGRAARNNGFELASIGNSGTDFVDHLFQRISQRQLINPR